ncbi:MAG: acyl-ACP--UDP-N-acetylglucosamine O-acyltransferase [Planctomycetes bacterium]|nr:acyl-ACP--UDP-N-acetylglucosamine O-acyltransferase [Planctomycetota bacterium]
MPQDNISTMPKIHPTAIVDPKAALAEDVEIGPHCLIEPDVKIGPGTVLLSHCIVRRYTTLGEGNMLDSFVVLGGEPQDLKFSPDTVSYLQIGDKNTFREGVTISRATTPGGATTVGSRTYWMGYSHAGHDTTVEDEAILANGALVAGHSVIGRGAILSGNVLIHQFVWIGERVMTQGGAATSQHIPPFCMLSRRSNTISTLNVIGLRRAPDITEADRTQIKEAFDLLYRKALTPKKALDEMDHRSNWGAPAIRFREFVRKVLAAQKPYNRGLCSLGDEHR